MREAKTHRIKLGHWSRRRGPANLVALCGLVDEQHHHLTFVPRGRPITCGNCKRIESKGGE